MKKRCVYCKEIIKEKAVGKLCKKCLALMEVKKSINFKCRPPQSCFTCPFPDCITSKVIITKLETKFLKAGAGVQSKKKGDTKND